MSSGHEPEGAARILKEWAVSPIKLLFNLEDQITYVGKWGISRALYLSVLFLGLYSILAHLIPHLPLYTFSWIAGTAPIWMPLALLIGGWQAWKWYIQSLYLSGRDPVLLEMRIPREITKSPRAMEIALMGLWLSSGETTFIHRAWKGQVRPFFSLEIASFGGDVHFYIWCWRNYVHTVQEGIYAMYPEVELHEVEDYATKFQYDPNVHNGFACEWMLGTSRMDRKNRTKKYGRGNKFGLEDVYPIKTYVEFELDKDPKEEFKVDPLASVIEFMSSIHEGEQLWAQLIIRKAGKYGTLITHERDDEWKHACADEIEFIRLQGSSLPGQSEEVDLDHSAEEIGKFNRFPYPSPRHGQMMEAIDRNMAKLPFEFLGRGMYWSTHALHGPTYTHLRWMWKPMGNSAYGTHLKPGRWSGDFDYPWQDIGEIRYKNQIRRAFDAYRRRSAFHTPWILPTNVLTTESLATLWRPPSSTVAAPGLERIPSKKKPAPLNLPR